MIALLYNNGELRDALDFHELGEPGELVIWERGQYFDAPQSARINALDGLECRTGSGSPFRTEQHLQFRHVSGHLPGGIPAEIKPRIGGHAFIFDPGNERGKFNRPVGRLINTPYDKIR